MRKSIQVKRAYGLTKDLMRGAFLVQWNKSKGAKVGKVEQKREGSENRSKE